MARKSLSEIDRNFERTEIGGIDLDIHPIPSGPMVLEGFAWYAREKVFCRLPQASLPNTNEGVENLAWCTAGGAIRFRTDSPTIALSATLADPNDMNHMPRTGSGGFDLYLGTGAEKRFVKSSWHVSGSDRVEAVFVTDLPREMRDCTIYFPLYSGVQSVQMGLTPGANLEAPLPLTIQAPLLFYGSSITQGGCASRPGNAYTAVVARWLDANHINLGFSGSARGETQIAELIASLNLSVFIMDYDHNAPTAEHLRKTHQPFFQILRDAQPELPVVFVSKPNFDEGQKDDRKRRDIIRSTYETAKNAGDENVYFVAGQTLFGKKIGNEDRDACTVDGCHPNDLGFYRMARAITPAVRNALGI